MGRRPARNETGAVFVEFVVVLPFLLFIIFAMVSYGAMFSFRQTLSQAATEGARAAAVAPANLSFSDRSTRAITAVNQAFQGEPGGGLACGSGGLTCTIPSTPTTCGTATECISVTVSYAYAAHPRVPVPQFFGFALPTTLRYTASARIS
ncbi:MAG TPA: TadE family protein [Aeromicrobium sp.]|nr:TadE family protein [Aeromicrobium sp.]